MFKYANKILSKTDYIFLAEWKSVNEIKFDLKVSTK